LLCSTIFFVVANLSPKRADILLKYLYETYGKKQSLSTNIAHFYNGPITKLGIRNYITGADLRWYEEVELLSEKKSNQ